MIKVEVLENFTFARYDEIKGTLQRKSKEEKGRLFAGDIFECTQEMTDYLLGDNPIKRAVVKVIEVIPEKNKVEKTETVKKDKPKTETTIKKETKSKKTIAKK